MVSTKSYATFLSLSMYKNKIKEKKDKHKPEKTPEKKTETNMNVWREKKHDNRQTCNRKRCR